MYFTYTVFRMFKPLHILLIAFTLLSFVCNSQTVLDVKTFEYIWQNDYSITTQSKVDRVIIADNDSAKTLIKNSFGKALQQRWNVAMPDVSLSVKKLPVLSFRVKFKTTLKDKEPGKWYLFLQVYDMGNSGAFNFNGSELFSTLNIKCRIIAGQNDSLILDKEMVVSIYNESPPPDQALLKKLAVYPMSFVHAFDSIATWLFAPGSITERSLTLKPACAFQQAATKNGSVKELQFKNDNESIQLLTSPAFTFHTGQTTYQKTDTKRNFGGNAVSGALTIFTGLSTNKSRKFLYNADFPFEEDSNTYHCSIHYEEEETKDFVRVKNEDRSFTTKSTSYAFSGRHIEPGFLHIITIGTDTLATFRIEFSKKVNTAAAYDKMWDGGDSTTVTFLPPAWNNNDDEANVTITGTIAGDPFAMKMQGNTGVKEIFINDRSVMLVVGNNKPVRAQLFQSLSDRQLKIFTILSSLPYTYFNVSYQN